MDILKINACPLCEGTQLAYVMTCTDCYATGEKFEIYQCNNCGFTFTQNTPSGKEIDKYYHAANYISHTDTKKGLMNSIYHRVRKRMLKEKVRLVMKASHRKRGKLLDIGTGTGYFANAMRKETWKVDAIEKNEEARSFAKEQFRLNVKDEKALDELAAGSYDVITLWHVLEHLEKLEHTWTRLNELLTDKGILIIAVPNYSSYDAKKYKANWAAYDVPRHIWHFTPATMQRFGIKHGFIMAAHYPMPFDAFYVSMLSEKNTGSKLSFLKGAYTGTIAWFHSLVKKEKSSSIIYIFRKKQDEK
ncbi:methyltransferase domain-containing protein [Bacteroides sp. 214]|uniref:methyltransferase domain-containing protein n=1 Tax=Bacteroides sp. 214 TaxID=2302935 RepID=UPI0013D407B1|nr:methyltransferase domain-containing protein [Bacteroides sp. 214]NDW13868.1 methyltransferase domain-containing protein [Bacteroides sp. 214]